MYRIPLKRRPDKPVHQYRIAVAGISPQCGVSFISGCVALSQAENGPCTLAELGSPYFCTALNIEMRFGEGFVFYEDALTQRKSLLTIRNDYRGINLLLRRPDSKGFPSGICACKMPGEVAVFDLSSAPEALLDEVLPEMDRIYIVIDPLPSKLIPAAEKLERLRLLYPDARIIVNKMNKGVHRSELRKFAGAPDLTEVPYLDPSVLYKAEYSCVLPAEIKEAAKAVPDLFT